MISDDSVMIQFVLSVLSIFFLMSTMHNLILTEWAECHTYLLKRFMLQIGIKA